MTTYLIAQLILLFFSLFGLQSLATLVLKRPSLLKERSAKNLKILSAFLLALVTTLVFLNYQRSQMIAESIERSANRCSSKLKNTQLAFIEFYFEGAIQDPKPRESKCQHESID